MTYRRSAYIVFFISLLLVIGIVYTLMASAVRETTIDLSKMQRIQLSNLVPEGWAFFTRDPKEDNPVLYRLEKGKPVPFTIIAGSWRNCFGLNRYSRMVTKELGTLMEYVKEAPHAMIEGEPKAGMSAIDTLKSITVPNAARHPLLQGEFLIRFVQPIPWAWANTPGIEGMTSSKIVKINVVQSKK